MHVHKWIHFPIVSRFWLHGVQSGSSCFPSSALVSVSFWNQITSRSSNLSIIQSAYNWITNYVVTYMLHPYKVYDLAPIYVTVSMKFGIVLIQLISWFTFFNLLVNLFREDILWSLKVNSGSFLIGSLGTSIVFSQWTTPCHVNLSPHLHHTMLIQTRRMCMLQDWEEKGSKSSSLKHYIGVNSS
jgi:hypothetical protein